MISLTKKCSNNFPPYKKNQLPNSDLSLYIHMKHYLTTSPLWSCKIPQPAWILLSAPIARQKGISLFYNLFQQKSIFTNTTPLLKWESNLGCTYTIEQWSKACSSIYKATDCSTLWELTIKLSQCWYLTPR